MKQGQETNQIWTQEAGTDDTQQNPDITPPRRNSSTREGGWALWRPLRTDTDRNTGRGPPERNRQIGGHGGAGSSGGHGRAGSSGDHGGAGSSGGHGGVGSSGGHGGAGSSGGHGGAGSSGGHGRSSSGPWPRSPQPGPHSRNSFYPPQKFPWVSEGVSHDMTTHRNRKPSWASSEAEASSGHDKTSGALTRFPQLPPPLPQHGGWWLEWPPRPQQEEPPAPDKSPWTRQDMTD